MDGAGRGRAEYRYITPNTPSKRETGASPERSKTKQKHAMPDARILRSEARFIFFFFYSLFWRFHSIGYNKIFFYST